MIFRARTENRNSSWEARGRRENSKIIEREERKKERSHQKKIIESTDELFFVPIGPRAEVAR